MCLALFVIPESTTAEQRALARSNDKGKAPDSNSGNDSSTVATDEGKAGTGIIAQFLSPLAIFLPVLLPVDGSTRQRRDWSLTLLAASLLGFMLSTVSDLSHLRSFSALMKWHDRACTKSNIYMLAMFMAGVRSSFRTTSACWARRAPSSSFLSSLVRCRDSHFIVR